MPRPLPSLTARVDRGRPWFGLLGPAGFITGWLSAGLLRPGYSFRRDAISQLARRGTPKRLLMTAALVEFGVAMPIFGRALATRLGRPRLLEVAVALAGIGTLGVAAFPLGQEAGGRVDRVHTYWAVAGYIGTAATPLLASRALARRGYPAAAACSVATGVVSATLLAATARTRQTGLYQRLGLTVVDCWFMVAAASMLRCRSRLNDT